MRKRKVSLGMKSKRQILTPRLKSKILRKNYSRYCNYHSDVKKENKLLDDQKRGDNFDWTIMDKDDKSKPKNEPEEHTDPIAAASTANTGIKFGG